MAESEALERQARALAKQQLFKAKKRK